MTLDFYFGYLEWRHIQDGAQLYKSLVIFEQFYNRNQGMGCLLN